MTRRKPIPASQTPTVKKPTPGSGSTFCRRPLVADSNCRPQEDHDDGGFRPSSSASKADTGPKGRRPEGSLRSSRVTDSAAKGAARVCSLSVDERRAAGFDGFRMPWSPARRPTCCRPLPNGLSPRTIRLVLRARRLRSRCHRSTFFTGSLAAVSQPLRSQPSTHFLRFHAHRCYR